MKNHDLIGAGGGGKGGGGASTRVPKEDPNTLRSNSTVRLLDLIGEGEIVGLVDGLKSVYIDETPVMSENGDLNFEGLTIHTRNGEPNQNYIPGFASIESEVSVGSEIKQATPIVRSVQNSVVDAVRIKIRVPALTFQNKENGDLKGSSVSLKIEVQSSGDSYRHARDVVISGKTTSPYERSIRVNLTGNAPWNIRVTRITPDSDTATIRNETFWTSFTEIIDSKLTYPDSALIGIEVDAKQFGSSVPSRSYHVRGRIIKVPSNYNPITRAYQGFWNGQFKLAYSNNPAWVYYDMATHPRYGANINADKWALYEIGKYCDEFVPNGYGDLEPRFTVNTVITDAKDAIHALNTLASAFRGMTYWGTSTVMPVADSPSDPVKLVTPANVVEGMFEYAGTGLKARHSAALVTWNDPEDNYRQQVEVVEDPEAIQQFGWKTTDITAFGCTSRGMANRLGRWLLYSERSETETVSYTAGTDHADLRPGDIIAVSDPSTAGARLGGRILTGGTHTLTLDQIPDQVSGLNWYIDVVLPDGSIVHRGVSFNGNQVTLSSGIPQAPIVGAVYILSAQQVEPRLFRVLSVAERNESTYQITAIQHNPNKYAEVELGLSLAERGTSLIPTGSIAPPMDITIETYTYLAGGQEHQAISISWTASDDPRVSRYICEAKGPSDTEYVTVSTDASLTGVILNAEPGQWSVRVRSVSAIGQFSPWVIRTTNVAGLLLPLPPTTVDIKASTFSIAIIPFGLTPGALWEFRRSNVALELSQIESNAVMLGFATQLTDTGLNHSTPYFYYIRGVNAYGVSNWYPVQATTSGDVSAIINSLFEKVSKDAFIPELQESIDLIEAQGNLIANETADRIAAINQEAQNRLDDISQERIDRADQISQEALERVNAIQDERDQRNIQIGVLQSDIDTLDLGLTEEISIRQSENAYQALQVSVLLAAQENSSAAVQSLNTVYTAETNSLANSINAVQSSLDGKADALAVQNLTTLVSAADSKATAASTAITALQNSLFDNDGEINLEVTGVFDLNTRVESVEGALSSQGQAIVDLQSSIVDVADAQAFQLLEAKVTQNEQDISSTSSDLTLLQSTLESQIGSSLAVQELTSTLEDLDGQISSVTSNLTELSSVVNDDITAEVSSLSQSIADESSARVSSVSTLTNQLGDLQGQIIQESTARAEDDNYTSLLLAVQTAAFENASSAITAASEINITENGLILENINALQGQIGNVQGGVISLQQIQLSEAQSRVSALQQLDTKFTGEISSAVTNLNEAISDETQARASDVSVLNTQLGEVEGQIVQEASIRAQENSYTSLLLTAQTAAFDNASAAIATASEINITENGLIVESINSLQGQIGAVQGGIVTIQQLQLSETQSRVTAIQQLTSEMSGQAATLETQAQVIDGLSASYVLKADVGGVLSGYGFAADASAGSRFTIASDRFALVAPTVSSSTAPANPYPGMVWRNTTNNDIRFRNRANTAWVSEPDTVPFVIQTSPSADAPAGVYMDTTFIRDASIDIAKIKDLNVEMASIADAAITNFELGEGTVGSAEIADTLQSINFSSKTGWQINKSGTMILNEIEARGNISGSTIKGSVIEGSLIIGGTELVIPTDVDNPSNTRHLGNAAYTWSFSGPSTQGTYSRIVPIRSSRHTGSGTQNYNGMLVWRNFERYMKTYISPQISISSVGHMVRINGSVGNEGATCNVTVRGVHSCRIYLTLRQDGGAIAVSDTTHSIDVRTQSTVTFNLLGGTFRLTRKIVGSTFQYDCASNVGANLTTVTPLRLGGNFTSAGDRLTITARVRWSSSTSSATDGTADNVALAANDQNTRYL